MGNISEVLQVRQENYEGVLKALHSIAQSFEDAAKKMAANRDEMERAWQHGALSDDKLDEDQLNAIYDDTSADRPLGGSIDAYDMARDEELV